MMKVKVPPIKAVDQNLGNVLYEAFENQLDLCVMARLDVDGRSVGAYVLNKGKIGEQAKYQVVFAFCLNGFHDQFTSEEISSTAAAIAEAMKFLPQGERCRFVMGRYSQDGDRLEYLSNLAKTTSLTLPRILLQNEQLRVHELTEKGKRQQWKQIIFCTWTSDEFGESKTDLLSKLIHSTTKNLRFVFDGLAGKLSQRQEEFFGKLLLKAYTEGFLQWEILFSIKAGLNVRALNETQMWQWIWGRFNRTTAPPIPQLLFLSKQFGEVKVQERRTTNTHAATILIEGELGRSSCPSHHGNTARIYVKDKVCGVMVMTTPPKAWVSLDHQLSSIWQTMAQSHFNDVEIMVELSRGSTFMTQENLHRHAKQSKAARDRAFLQGVGRDAGAEVQASEAYEAQKKLYKGAVPINCAVVFIVYRDDPRTLDMGCDSLAHSFGNAKVVRERDIASKIWLETLPITWKRLLHSSSLLSGRLLTLENETVAGVLPLLCPHPLDRLGVEFLSEPGGKSVCVDLFTKTRHALVTGMTGGGKSVLLWRFMLDALSRNIPVVGMDFPATDGESSFKTGISLLGEQGAYFDISSASSNIMEPPDLRQIPPEEREKRMNNWENFIRQILCVIVMGRIDHPHLAQRVDSILRQTLAVFLCDPDIIDRYNEAFAYGWKSEQWQKMPVLADFIRYCTVARLSLKKPSELDHMAINQITSQISALLVSPLGNAIGSPSSFSPEPMVKFFALTGLSNDQDAYIMAVSAQAACVRVAMSHPKSLFVGDELSVLCNKDGFSEMLGNLCATARKDGLSILMSTQDPNTIAESSSAAMIMQNVTYRLTGKITSKAVESFVHYFGYDSQLISLNASDVYAPRPVDICSCWLIERDNKFWQTRFYPGEMILASIANNKEEKMPRALIMSQYPPTLKGQLQALRHFTKEYIPALKLGQGFDHIGKSTFQE